MKTVWLAAIAAIGFAGGADAWTCISPVSGYKVTASMAPAPHGTHGSLRVAVAADDGAPAAMKLHAWFIDEDGAILAEAPLSQPQSSGATLIGTSDVEVPGKAASMVVIGQPTDGAKARAIATQFRIPASF